VAFLALPLIVVAAGLTQPHVAWDFHHELYPQAKLMVSGVDPYPKQGHNPATGTNYVWPPLAAYIAVPLTALSHGTADVIAALLGLMCFYAALWLVGLRDWRVFGLVTLWPSVYVELGLSHLTPVVALLAAATWRFRDSSARVGIAVGIAVAIKFFCWPLAVWLAATRRSRSAFVAVALTLLSTALVLPYTNLRSYVDALVAVGRAFDQDAYTVFGLFVQAGAPEFAGRVATAVAAGFLLVATWQYRSFALAIASALAASPIVWLDYFALAAIPLAITRPRLSWVWFLPLATIGLEGAGLAIGDPEGTFRVLATFAIVFWVAFRGERRAVVVPSTEDQLKMHASPR
jgi:hypothetical protein